MPEIPDTLLRYLATRDTERDDHVNRALSALSERERALVSEAAVMGYVQGRQDEMAGTFFPKDTDIAWRVIDACRAFDGLYPTISGLANEGESRG